MRKEKVSELILLIGLFIIIHVTPSHAQDNFPYFSDFESDDGGLTATGSWQWGLPTAGPDTAHSGFTLWGTNLTGNYPDEADDYLDLPPIDLANVSSVRLSFWHWYEIEADGAFWDGGNVKVSVNGGPFEVITPFRGYDGVGEETPLEDEPVFGGFEEGVFWQKEVFNLQNFVGNTIVIRFHMGSDCDVNYSGWYIDDVSVAENFESDLAVLAIEAPGLGVDTKLPPVEPVVNVYNAGGKTQSFDTEVTITVDGVEDYVSRKLTHELGPDEQIQVAFDPWRPSKSAGRFHLLAQTLALDDEDPSNDTLSVAGEIFEKKFSNITSLAGVDGIGFISAVAWGDFDNDGFVDVALSQGSSSGNFSGNDARIYLLRNNGDRTFRHAGDISIANGVWAPRGKWGDYDSDGDLDLIVASRRSSALGSEVSAVFLYRSNAGTFTNITNTAGFISINNTAQSTLWLDYDNDGYLDLFVDYRNKQSFGARGTDHLYHNNGDATFSEVLTSGDLGIDYSGERSGINADYDDDGFTDFLFWSGSSGTGLLLFHNKGDGTFEEVTAEAGISSDDRCIGAAFGDYDNDGKLDLYVLRHDQLGGPRPDRLFNNNGDGTFSEVGSQAGVSELLLISSEPPSWADYDNDGYLDLLAFEQQRAGFSGSIPRLYRNNGDETFTIVDAFPNVSAGIEGAAWADYDNDGDLDLLARAYTEGAILHRNNNNDNGWLSINLLGTQSHKNGYGARIRLRAGGLLQVRQINDGSGYTQHSLRAHFGLGKATVVDTLEIRWPSGQVDLLTNVDVSQIITVEEGNGMITGVTAKPLQSSVPETFKLAQNYPNPFNPGTRISFETSESGQVQLTIYNLLGQEVITLVDEKRNAGEFVELWDGNDRSGKAVPSGVYVYRLQAGEFVESRKMLLLR